MGQRRRARIQGLIGVLTAALVMTACAAGIRTLGRDGEAEHLEIRVQAIRAPVGTTAPTDVPARELCDDSPADSCSR